MSLFLLLSPLDHTRCTLSLTHSLCSHPFICFPPTTTFCFPLSVPVSFSDLQTELGGPISPAAAAAAAREVEARFHKIDGKVRQSESNDWPQLQCPKSGEFLVVHIALNFMKPPPSLNLLLRHHARHLFLSLLAFQFRERRMDRRAERRFFKRSNLFLFVFFSPVPEGSPPRPIFVSIRLYGGVGWNGFYFFETRRRKSFF